MIDELVLSSLQRGQVERFELPSEATLRIAHGLARVVEKPTAVAELRRLLAMIAALRTQLESPSAAAALEAIVRKNLAAVRLIGFHILHQGALSEERVFKAREGRSDPLMAPHVDTSAPKSTIRLADLLDPASAGRIRKAKKSKEKEWSRQ